jgi:optic atrophy protein 1
MKTHSINIFYFGNLSFSIFQCFHTIFSSKTNYYKNALRPLIINVPRVNYSMLTYKTNGRFHAGNRHRLLDNHIIKSPHNPRNFGMLVGRIIRGALKIRYVLLGGAVGGTVTLNRVRHFKSY